MKVALQLHNLPAITAADIRGSHAPWGENRVASVTNLEADVWITHDKLRDMPADMSSCFHDVPFQFAGLRTSVMLASR